MDSHFFLPLWHKVKQMPKNPDKGIALNKKGDKRRTHPVAFMLNDQEWECLNYYLRRFRVANKSKFLRDTVMRRVIDRLQDENPGLFD